MFKLESFPPELLVQTLLYIPPLTIVNLSLANKFFYSLINESIEIKAKLVCAKYGVSFNPEFSQKWSLDKKVKYLEDIEANWNRGVPRKVLDVARPEKMSGLYDLCGGQYIIGSRDKKSLFSLPLRSPNPTWRKIELDTPAIDFGLAIYEHDLLAYVTYETTPTSINLLLHLCRFSQSPSSDSSTLLPHPEAREAHILLHRYSPHPQFRPPQLGLETVGDYLTLLVLNTGTEDGLRESHDFMMVYNWRTGERKLRTTFISTYYSPIPISTTLTAMVNCRENTLDFYPLTEAYFRWAEDSARPRPVFKLALPKLARSSRMLYSTSRCEPNPNSLYPGTKQFPEKAMNDVEEEKGDSYRQEVVMTDSQDAIVTIYVHILPPNTLPMTCAFAMYVKRSTLLRLYEENLGSATPLPEPSMSEEEFFADKPASDSATPTSSSSSFSSTSTSSQQQDPQNPDPFSSLPNLNMPNHLLQVLTQLQDINLPQLDALQTMLPHDHPLNTFLNLRANRGMSSKLGGGINGLPGLTWEEWGEDGMRVFNNTYPREVNTDWITTSCGGRVVRYGPDGLGLSDEEDVDDDDDEGDEVYMDVDDWDDDGDEDDAWETEPSDDWGDHGDPFSLEDDDTEVDVEIETSFDYPSTSNPGPSDSQSTSNDDAHSASLSDDDVEDYEGDAFFVPMGGGQPAFIGIPPPEPLPHRSGITKLEILDFRTSSVWEDRVEKQKQKEEEEGVDEETGDAEGEGGQEETRPLYDPMRCFEGKVWSRLPFVRRKIKWNGVPVVSVTPDGDVTEGTSTDKGKEKDNSPAEVEEDEKEEEPEERYDGVLIEDENLVLIKRQARGAGEEPLMSDLGRIKILRFSGL